MGDYYGGKMMKEHYEQQLWSLKLLESPHRDVNRSRTYFSWIFLWMYLNDFLF